MLRRTVKREGSFLAPSVDSHSTQKDNVNSNSNQTSNQNSSQNQHSAPRDRRPVGAKAHR